MTARTGRIPFLPAAVGAHRSEERPEAGGATTTGLVREQERSGGSSVWPIAQRSLAAQRNGRYLQASGEHPGRMAPDLAAYAITAYTRPGDLVLDPLCGTGTTLVEAVHAGRRAYGLDIEDQWADRARQNLAFARAHGATGTGVVSTGDARRLVDHVPPDIHGQVALVLTSPPYGPRSHTHTRVHVTRDSGHPGVHRFRNSYGDRHDQANLANLSPEDFDEALTRILTGCAHLLRSDGHLVITARPWRHQGELVDLPSRITDAAERAGLAQTDRCIALLARRREDRLTARPSFLQLVHLRRARRSGTAALLLAHEDALIYQLATRPTPLAAPTPDSPPPDGGRRDGGVGDGHDRC